MLLQVPRVRHGAGSALIAGVLPARRYRPGDPGPPFEHPPHILEDEEGEDWHFHLPWVVFTDANAAEYRARKRRCRTACLLWLIGWPVGAHHFYAGRPRWAFVVTGVFLLAAALDVGTPWGGLAFVCGCLLMIVDLVLMCDRVRAWNERLAARIGTIVPY